MNAKTEVWSEVPRLSSTHIFKRGDDAGTREQRQYYSESSRDDNTSTVLTSEDDEEQLNLDHAADDNEADDEYVSVNTSLILGIGETILRTVCMVSKIVNSAVNNYIEP